MVQIKSTLLHQSTLFEIIDNIPERNQSTTTISSNIEFWVEVKLLQMVDMKMWLVAVIVQSSQEKEILSSKIV